MPKKKPQPAAAPAPKPAPPAPKPAAARAVAVPAKAPVPAPKATNAKAAPPPNQLLFGDNIGWLRDREKFQDESVDLIYLDPPFNSQQDYNVLFEEHTGDASAAQIRAFEDTWHWNPDAEAAYTEIAEKGDQVSVAIQALRQMLQQNDMMAYLAMMAPRLVELHRVLKPTGSIYLHCDPSASHYLKVLMDAIFGAENFRNEIVWKRTSGHSDAERYGRVHDTILYYVKSDASLWNKQYTPYDKEYADTYYRYTEKNGRRFMSADLGAAGLSGGGYEYEWKGVKRVWRCPIATMQRLEKEGRIFYTRNGIPRLKRYLDEAKGMPMQDVWNDIEALRSWHKEKISYPTQKPEALLERILFASSNEGDVVLDPFCGCGTAVAVSQRLNRSWIGIDITSLAIGLIKRRLVAQFGDDAKFVIDGQPTTPEEARALALEDRYLFQWWAVDLVDGWPMDKKKGGDKGIDGRIFFHDEEAGKKAKQVIISVKSGNLNPGWVRDLVGTVDREKASIGVLLTLDEPTKGMVTEAITAGFYTSPMNNRKYPRIQVLSIEDIMRGGKTVQHPKSDLRTFKLAPKAKPASGPDLFKMADERTAGEILGDLDAPPADIEDEDAED